jgi:hypothetical protein
MLWYTYIFCFFRHFSYLLIICEKIQLFPEVSLLLTAAVQHKDLTGSVIGLAATTPPPLLTQDGCLCAASATAAILETIAVRTCVV